MLGLSTKVKAPLYSSFEAFYCRSKRNRRPQPTFQWSSQLPLASWFQSIPKPTTTILRLRQLINQRQYLCLEQLLNNKMRNIFCHGWYFAVKYINRRHSNGQCNRCLKPPIEHRAVVQPAAMTHYKLVTIG